MPTASLRSGCSWKPCELFATIGGYLAENGPDELSERLLANASAQGAFLLNGLRELWRQHQKTITDVRGEGLVIGVELRTAELAELVQLRAFERGLLVLECGESSIRVSPPLVITRDQAATALKILGEVFESLI